MNHETRHSFASIDGLRLHWAELGDAAPPTTPVVLLHGLNDSYLTWRRAAPELALDRRVLLPDLAGHGLSERPDASYTLAWHTKIIARWLETLNLEKVDVIGHSFGGGVAQMLLLECPARIRRMVLVAPGGLGRGVTPALRMASLPRAVELMGQPFMALGTRVALRGKRDGFSQQDIAELSKMNSQPGSARVFGRTVRDVISWRGQQRRIVDRIHEVKTFPPTTICWGNKDKIISIAQGRAFARFMEGIRLHEFPGCGHYPHNQEPDTFVRIVRAFLDDPAPQIPRVARSGNLDPHTTRELVLEQPHPDDVRNWKETRCEWNGDTRSAKPPSSAIEGVTHEIEQLVGPDRRQRHDGRVVSVAPKVSSPRALRPASPGRARRGTGAGLSSEAFRRPFPAQQRFCARKELSTRYVRP